MQGLYAEPLPEMPFLDACIKFHTDFLETFGVDAVWAIIAGVHVASSFFSNSEEGLLDSSPEYRSASLFAAYATVGLACLYKAFQKVDFLREVSKTYECIQNLLLMIHACRDFILPVFGGFAAIFAPVMALGQTVTTATDKQVDPVSQAWFLTLNLGLSTIGMALGGVQYAMRHQERIDDGAMSWQMDAGFRISGLMNWLGRSFGGFATVVGISAIASTSSVALGSSALFAAPAMIYPTAAVGAGLALFAMFSHQRAGALQKQAESLGDPAALVEDPSPAKSDTHRSPARTAQDAHAAALALAQLGYAAGSPPEGTSGGGVEMTRYMTGQFANL